MNLLKIGCCIFFVALATCDEVEDYENAINKFINDTKYYTYPKGNNLRVVKNECKVRETYDIIVVGAGTTGSVLANRLSRFTNLKVAVIEAGGDDSIITEIPAMFDYLRMSKYNWGYFSKPQTNSLKGYNDFQEIMPRGKVVGGSSTINALMYVRGNKKDFDDIAAQTSSLWSSDNILKRFKQQERATKFSPQDPNYHGFNGELNVTQIKVLTPLTQAFIDANVELGTPNLDYNAENQMCTSLIQSMVENGRRVNGAKAFLKPALTKKNLELILNAFVTKVDIRGNRATGVQFIKDDKKHCFKARKEVILSAGTFNTPQILMLSGIGPKDHLRKQGIRVIKDLPVGNNMWDHLVFTISVVTNLTLPNHTQTEDVRNYLYGNGPLTVPDGVQALRFVSFNNSDSYPDVEHIFRAGTVPVMPYQYYKQTKNFNQETYQYTVKPLEGKVVWNSLSMLLHPKSRGTVRLKNSSPREFPVIDPNYFSDPNNEDIKTIINAFNDVQKLVATESMQKYGSKLFLPENPGCASYETGTPEHLECSIRYFASTIHHFSGTCKMGRAEDPTTVVNDKLLVHGFKNLRVADCSVIPEPTSGHTTAVAYVIGETLYSLLENKQ